MNILHTINRHLFIVNKNGRSSLSVSLFLGNGKERDNAKNAREEGSKKGMGRSSKAIDLIRSCALKHVHLRNNCRCEKKALFKGILVINPI